MENQENMPKFQTFAKKTLFFGVFAFVFAAFVCLVHFYPHFLLPTSTQVMQSLNSPSTKLYFISLSKSQVEAEAVTHAADYQAIGAGGFVWKKDEYFHIIASCYQKENDAVLVQSNIKVNHNLESEIFEVDFASVSLSGDFQPQEKKVLSKALKIFVSTYQQLFDIAISLDTNVYNDISARLAVNDCYGEFNSTLTDFNTLFSAIEQPQMQKLQNLLQNGVSVLEKLCSGKLTSANQTYSSLIKYRYTQLLQIFWQYLSTFS